jgi:methylenetetrahydrofolate dehydrogenase (NADP+)/methenyltetrahydrofolate cyclohydrolase
MKILDGQKLAKQWEKRLLLSRPKQIGDLAGVLIGRDPASVLYLRLKAKLANRLGIGFRLCELPASSSKKTVADLIEKLNRDEKVGGIIVQLPLPAKFSTDEVVNLVSPQKDVDGLSDSVIAKGDILPATAAGIVEMLRAYKIIVAGKNIVMVGFTRLLNVPLAIYLARMGGYVTVLQEDTKDFKQLCEADIIITAVGRRNLIKASDVKPGAVVIDAGIIKEDGKLYGDVDFSGVAAKVSAITPVPGGVGPMTLTGLVANLIALTKSATKG